MNTDQCLLWGEILNTPIDVNYTTGAACTIYVSDTINFKDLRKQVRTNLDLLPSQYKLTIKA
jgi:hypothetical protein